MREHRIHYLQHVAFEGPAYLETWARTKGNELTQTQLFQDEPFPDENSFDWLVILGGPMNIYEEKEYPWLVREKKFTENAIVPFHWHGDTFAIPRSAKRMAQSAGCANQAFEYGSRVIGLQFHLESNPSSIANLIEHCAQDITPGPYTQKENFLDLPRIREANHLFASFLNQLDVSALV